MKTIQELMCLKGRKVLITGGAGYIGAAVSEALVELGAVVALVDVHEQRCQVVAESLNKKREGAAVSIPCNLKDEAAVRSTVHKAASAMGGLDILIHSAAYVGTTQLEGWAASFEEQTVKAWDEAMRVNLTSAFVLAQEAKRFLENSGRGSIIFFDSIYGAVGPDMRLYEGTEMHNPVAGGVAKGGLLQLSRYLATLFAPKIRVNAISPGGVYRNQPGSFCERYISRTPLNRMATEEDMKGAVVYLASDLSRYVTGHNLMVDGGWTAW